MAEVIFRNGNSERHLMGARIELHACELQLDGNLVACLDEGHWWTSTVDDAWCEVVFVDRPLERRDQCRFRTISGRTYVDTSHPATAWPQNTPCERCGGDRCVWTRVTYDRGSVCTLCDRELDDPPAYDVAAE